jgi:hypothetical protein
MGQASDAVTAQIQKIRKSNLAVFQQSNTHEGRRKEGVKVKIDLMPAAQGTNQASTYLSHGNRH